MCNERERLIGFLYDEVDASEARAIEAHLAECPDCRREIAGLRSTRQDLLAWAVPDHEPVWRPLSVERPVPVWQQIPTWALASAAAAVLAVGMAGGLASRWLLPAQAPSAATAQAAAAVAPVAVAPVIDEAAVEARVLARLRDEWRRELAADSARVLAGTTVVPATTRAGQADRVETISRQLSELTDRFDEFRDRQSVFNFSIDTKTRQLGSRTNTLGADLERTQFLLVSDTNRQGLGR